MLLSRIWRHHYFSIRQYASRSPPSLGSNRGYQGKDDIPGTDAIFNKELKKMKGVVGQSIDPEFEDDEIQQREALQKVNQDLAKRGSAMNYAKRAKYLGMKSEKRTLTWDNIDKIRYLKQEHPEEWTVSQLAASFEVSVMTIKKVLKSKYTPHSEKRKLQDTLTLKNTGREKKETFSVDTSIVPNTAPQTSSNVRNQHETDYASPTDDSPTDGSKMIRHKEPRAAINNSEVNVSDRVSRTLEQDSQTEDDWDEVENSTLEDELEEAEAFSSLTPSDFVKAAEDGTMPPKMIQKGQEFYDSDGEFLFKI